MAIGYGKPCPKPRPEIEDRIAYKRDREAREREFRLAVWLRDGSQCRACHRKVLKTISLVAERGEVHHRRGRNVTPEDRFNVSAAVLLCARCHKDTAVIAKFRRTA